MVRSDKRSGEERGVAGSRARSVRGLLVSALVGVGLMGLGGMGGCSAFQNATVARPSTAEGLPADAWPARDHTRARAAAERTAIATEALPLTANAVIGAEGSASLGGRNWFRRLPPVESANATGEGVLRVFAPQENLRAFSGAGEGTTETHAGEFGRVMRFVSYSDNPDRPVDERRSWITSYLDSIRMSAGENGEEAAAREEETIRTAVDGLRMRLSEHTGPEGLREPRGLLVYFPGLGSSEYELPLVRELQGRGWAVLSVSTPRVWWYEPMKFEIASREAIPGVAKRIAAAMDDQLAEPAYALEAGLSYVKLNRPTLEGKPVVVMGFSAGSLFAPAAVARVREHVDAVVLIGTGGNVLEISQTSDLTNGGVELVWPRGGVPHEWRQAMFREYLAASRLDPVHAVRAMGDKPMLLGLAEFDTTVPAKNGLMMVDAMPGADRLNFSVGHRLMFWKLGNRKRDVADWVEKNVGVAGGADVGVKR